MLQRALVYLLFERVGFDADQAIVGLMAKHLSQGRAFPLFLYGQTYMLAIKAWAAVPFFLIGGPTVGALRLSMLAWNVAFGFLLVAMCLRYEIEVTHRTGWPISALLFALAWMTRPEFPIYGLYLVQ